MKPDEAHNSIDHASCKSCGAHWMHGAFNEGCEQCGGGAMEIACVACGGRCGSLWKRMILDSQDSGIAHWIGGCLLSDEEKRACSLECVQSQERLQRDPAEGPHSLMRKRTWWAKLLDYFRSNA